MAEKIKPEIRSRMMAGIRGSNTKPEMQVRSGLHALGFRFRLHGRELPGKPDVVLPKWGAVIFVHGCFWHGHAGCPYFRLPKTRPEFWTQKISGNSQRDSRAVEALLDAGWRVGIVWECALRADAPGAVAKLSDFIRSQDRLAEISGFE